MERVKPVDRNDTAERPKTGISLLVLREFDDVPHVLLGQRRGSHGEGEWGTPGGHLENGETFEQGALGELLEECGDEIEVTRPRFLCVTNLRAYLPRHYVDIGMVSFWKEGVPRLMEPEKCLGWTWHPIDKLPVPLFAPVENLVIAYHTGQAFFE
jgi:8-oxo-dGTP diphosphatase